MIFTRAEIDVLRLAAWCKDLPAAGIDILPGETIRLLLALGLLRQSRCGLSYRPTPAGYSLLREAGFRNMAFTGAGRIPYLWRHMVFSAEAPAAAEVRACDPAAEP